jgi:hypothetical protein
MLGQSASSSIILALSSFNHDFHRGRMDPSPVTISLLLEGIQRIQEHIRNPERISDDTISAVICLWAYEVALLAASPVPRGRLVDSTRIEAHLSGLERSIRCRGGLSKLAPATVWALAWGLSTMPGYSPVDTRTLDPSFTTALDRPLRPGDYHCLSRMFDTLSIIHQQMSFPDMLASVFDETDFAALKTVLSRLSNMRLFLNEMKTPIGRLRKSAALISTILFIFDILLGGRDRTHRQARFRRVELLQVQQRLMEHHITKEGSFEKAWQVVMTRQEVPTLHLHPRAWAVVEMVNIIKHAQQSTLDALSQLLLGYLLPEIRDSSTESFRYEKCMMQLHLELDKFGQIA